MASANGGWIIPFIRVNSGASCSSKGHGLCQVNGSGGGIWFIYWLTSSIIAGDAFQGVWIAFGRSIPGERTVVVLEVKEWASAGSLLDP